MQLWICRDQTEVGKYHFIMSPQKPRLKKKGGDRIFSAFGDFTQIMPRMFEETFSMDLDRGQAIRVRLYQVFG